MCASFINRGSGKDSSGQTICCGREAGRRSHGSGHNREGGASCATRGVLSLESDKPTMAASASMPTLIPRKGVTGRRMKKVKHQDEAAFAIADGDRFHSTTPSKRGAGDRRVCVIANWLGCDGFPIEWNPGLPSGDKMATNVCSRNGENEENEDSDKRHKVLRTEQLTVNQ